MRLASPKSWKSSQQERRGEAAGARSAGSKESCFKELVASSGPSAQGVPLWPRAPLASCATRALAAGNAIAAEPSPAACSLRRGGPEGQAVLKHAAYPAQGKRCCAEWAARLLP